MRNLGKVSHEWLGSVGIYTLADLKKSGAAAAYRLVKSLHPKVTLNLLWALEGAIMGVDWKAIPANRKLELRRLVR